MARITIDKFSRQSSAVPDRKSEPHYLMQGVYPDYTRNQVGLLETQPYPLAASPTLTSLTSGLNGNVASMIPCLDPQATAFLITDTTSVYKVNSNNTTTNFSYPSGFSVSNAGGQLATFNSNILVTQSLAGTVYRTLIAGGDTWHTVGSITSATGRHYMLPFLDFCAVVDGDATFGYGHLIKKITAAWTITTGIDLGGNWGAVGRLMSTGKYLVIPAGFKGGSSINSCNLYLWDGIASSWSYVVPVPGIYVDGITSASGVPYVLVSNSNSSYSVYKLVGVSLKWLFDFNYNIVSSAQPMSLFDTGMAILTTVGTLVFFDGGSQFFLDATVWPFASAAASAGQANSFYAASASNLSYFTRTSNPYNTITYKTHFMSGEKLTGAINWVRIYYDTPPSVTGDAITTSLNVVDELGINGGLANGTYALNTITPTTYDSSKYTQLDGKGVSFDKVQVAMTVTTGGGGTWFPIIRQIIIDYDPT